MSGIVYELWCHHCLSILLENIILDEVRVYMGRCSLSQVICKALPSSYIPAHWQQSHTISVMSKTLQAVKYHSEIHLILNTMLSMSSAAQFRGIHSGHQIQPGFFIGILLTCVTIATSLVLNSWNDIILNKKTGHKSYWTQPWTETNSFPVAFRDQLPVYLYVELKETTCIRELVVDAKPDTLMYVNAALTFSYPNTPLPFDDPAANSY